MSPEKVALSPTSEKRNRSGRLVLGYSQLATLMMAAFLFGGVLHSQFQTSCRVWEKGTSLASGIEDARNETDAIFTLTSTSFRDAEATTNSRKNSEKDPVLSEKDGNRQWPRIVWLMSFPNSGTSYTLKMIRYLTDRTTATNYGDRHRHASTGKSVSVYPGDEAGPFWTEPEEKYDKKRPSTYILTKTHCGGSCALCGPNRYVETPLSFLEQCQSGLRGTVDSKGKRQVQDVRYDTRKVSKAIHLIRHPFDNIVSRFHLEWNEHHKYNDTDSMPWIRKEFPANFERNPTGFRLFCEAMAKRYASQYKKSRFISEELVQELQDVPCYGDFMRWIQWHNLAMWTTRELQLDTYVLYYENYATRFNETISELLDFVKLPPVGSLVPFIAGKSYAETYFTESERALVKMAIQKLAFRDTWKLIEHYF